MNKSTLAFTEAVRNKLLLYPMLVDKLQQKDNDFLLSLEYWMRDIEGIFKQHQVSETSEIAGLRSRILAPIFEGNNRRLAKKKQIQIASECMYDLQSSILIVLKPIELKISEATELLVQLLSIIKQNGALKFNQGDFQSFVIQLWNIMYGHEQLKPTTFKILSILSAAEAQRIIADQVNPVEWS